MRNKLRYPWRNVLAAAWVSASQEVALEAKIGEHGLLSKLADKPERAEQVRAVLLTMLQDAWKRFESASRKYHDLKPDTFFFGTKEAAREVTHKLEKKFGRRLRLALGGSLK